MNAQELADLMPDASQLYSDEPEIESTLHCDQLALLVACLDWLWQDREDYFVGVNQTIYFSRQQLKSRDLSGPDFFLVRNTEKRPRQSWVVWEEGGKYPDLVIELLSSSTARIDRTLKKELYQNRFRTPEYFWFSPDTLEFAGFQWINQRYESIEPNAAGRLWSNVLGLYLGRYKGKLRYFSREGELVSTPEEAFLQAQSDADKAVAKAKRLAQQLQAMRTEPEA